MLLESQEPQKIEFLTYEQDRPVPIDRIVQAIQASMRSRRLDKAAVMADWETLEKLKPLLDAEYLEPDANFHWSGTQRTYSLKKKWKRVQLGDYEYWFRWFMAFQRFRAFHIVVMVEPAAAVADEKHGGYYDGFLARLIRKVIHKVIIIQTQQPTQANVPSREYLREALMAILCGTRLSFHELAETAKSAFIPLADNQTLAKELQDRWFWEHNHSRYRLRKAAEELVEKMLPTNLTQEEDEKAKRVFYRSKRSGPMHELPRDMLENLMLEDLNENGWVTAYGEWKSLFEKLGRLAHEEGSIIWNHFWGRDVPRRDVVDALRPQARLLRGILEDRASEGRLEKRTWFREIGRPTTAYFLPGRAPFLESRCGQCAFYVPAKRKCRLWWLVNWRRQHFEKWKGPHSTVTGFELHRMKWASRIGPHSSACMRFIDKKRDYNRKAVPDTCGICGQALRRVPEAAVTCRNCRTRYIRLRDKVKVKTAYEHEYRRLYSHITGGDLETDLQAWRKELKDRLALILELKTEAEDLDALAEESEAEERLLRVWPRFSQALQEKVDSLAATSDIARQSSMAMAKSARNATLRVIEIARLHESDVGRAIELQEKYGKLISSARPNELLTYEALIMKEYWRCFGVAVKLAQHWFGPRKRSRFVPEFVEDPAGRARGYSALDAAINYLHQRRLRRAERINAKVGFEGTCDGFIHKERYNSRGFGLLLDMIDPFKFADREVLLAVVLNGGVSWRDFKLERDRRGSIFYYPGERAKKILDQVGRDADEVTVSFAGHTMNLTKAYEESAIALLDRLRGRARTATSALFVYSIVNV